MFGRQVPVSGLSGALRTVQTTATLLVIGVLAAPLMVEATQTPSSTGVPVYAIMDLGTLGGTRSDAWALNNRGEVVGSAERTDNSMRAYVYSNGAMREIPLPGGTASEATGINDLGQIVGVIAEPGSTRHGFVYSTAEDVLRLDPVGSSANIPQAVSNSGHVTGALFPRVPDPVRPMRAYLADDHQVYELGTLSQGLISVGLSLNDRDEVAGWSGLANGHYRAFMYSNDELHDLGTLGGTSSQALWINASGQIVGTAETPNGISHAFLYAAGQMQDLGGLPGYAFTSAFGINARGRVVGGADQGVTLGHAWIWEDGSIVDLTERIPLDSGWVLIEARSINDLGQIVGNGMIGNQRHAFLLTPEAALQDDAGHMGGS